MKRLLGFVAAAVIGLSTVSAFAGDGCCMSGKAKSTSGAAGASCDDMFSKLNLTDSQKAQVDTLKESTKRATSTSEAHAMFNAGVEKILTPDQLTQFKAQCDKMKASGECPYMKSQKKS
jgi:Spy/CpxP family protein refolding chaperone